MADKTRLNLQFSCNVAPPIHRSSANFEPSLPFVITKYLFLYSPQQGKLACEKICKLILQSTLSIIRASARNESQQPRFEAVALREMLSYMYYTFIADLRRLLNPWPSLAYCNMANPLAQDMSNSSKCILFRPQDHGEVNFWERPRIFWTLTIDEMAF